MLRNVVPQKGSGGSEMGIIAPDWKRCSPTLKSYSDAGFRGAGRPGVYRCSTRVVWHGTCGWKLCRASVIPAAGPGANRSTEVPVSDRSCRRVPGSLVPRQAVSSPVMSHRDARQASAGACRGQTCPEYPLPTCRICAPGRMKKPPRRHAPGWLEDRETGSTGDGLRPAVAS